MPDIAAAHTDLTPTDIDYLQLLLTEWTLIADLAFADLLLWLPTRNALGFIAAAQIRPTTARTHIPEDLIGHFAARGRHTELDRAMATGEMCVGASTPKHELTQAVPIRRDGEVIALLGRYSGQPTAGRLEEAYALCAADLFTMVASGDFPRYTNSDQGTGGRGGAPRVGDGLMLLDSQGRITFASPNARSAFRRLGVSVDIENQVLADIVSSLNRHGEPINDTLSLVVRGRIQATSEVQGQQSCATIRSIPLMRSQDAPHTLMLIRDVTDIRRRDQALVGKDAAIREVHHRVKNNLQTVASLLRLQGRRLPDESSRNAIAEAGRRVATIAVVHDLLAHTPGATVDFDDVAHRVVALTIETSLNPAVQITFTGTFGVLSSDRATTLALVLAEIVANAVEHGASGHNAVVVDIFVEQQGESFTVVVTDNGPGIDLPVDLTRGLGLAIVSTLVTEELQGMIAFEHVSPSATSRGTRVVVRF